VAREDHPGEKRLVAYYVPQRETSASELRGFLAEKLPEYMVPSAFVELERLPLSPNGKLDRKALPAPDTDRPSGLAYLAPRTPTEEVLAAIWAAVLGVEKVSVRDDFFELGGHSLLATQLVSRVRDALDVELPIRALLEVRTVEQLAAEVEARQEKGEAPEQSPIARLPRGQRHVRSATRPRPAPRSGSQARRGGGHHG
jgi:acyl carrier protein